MRPRLPSLNAARAFEAAARHGSFRRAAEEMNVTHSAISHQVKALEEQLGVLLFSRGARTIALTEAGEVFYPVLRDAFDRIARGAEIVRTVESPNVLTVQVYVTMALRRLIPRLHRFQGRHPDIQVRLSTSYFEWEFDRGNVDLGVITRTKKEDGLHYRNLFESRIFPVCKPELMKGPNAIRRPEDLADQQLLHVYTAADDWERWFQAAGIDRPVPESGIGFDSFILALEAAVAGHGVALSDRLFAQPDLEAGRLVKPFDVGVDRHGAWYLVCAEGMQEQAKVRLFSEWLIEELAADTSISG